jgi:hypothetical protein
MTAMSCRENSMLHRRSLKRFMLISVALMGMAVSSANAMSLNIDFGQQFRFPDSLNYGAAADQIGHWNQISNTGTTELLDLSGLSTKSDVKPGIELSLTGTNVQFGAFDMPSADDGGDAYLLHDYFYAENLKPEWSIEISNLDIGKYDIYYYAPPNGNIATGAFSYNGNSDPGAASLDGVFSRPSTLVENESWGVLKDVSIGESGLLLEFLPGVESVFYGLSGLQLVQKSYGIVPISPVPVPAAVWLFGTALIGMIGFGKRRKAA